MKRLLPLAALAASVGTVLATNPIPVPPGYVGGQVPIVIAGGGPFKTNRTPSMTDPVVFVDNYVAGDGGYVARVDTAGFFPVYDAGSPVLVTAIRMKGYSEGSLAFTEQVCTARMGLFEVYASNDQTDWTLFWKGRGETISTAFETWHVRDAKTGALTVYTNSVAANAYDDSDKPFSTPYRYYRVEASPKSSIKYSDHRAINVSEFSLWTKDLAVRANRPAPYASATALASADHPDGVTFTGTLEASPSGSADIHVCVARDDFGADYASWRAGGRDITLAEGLAAGSAFSAKAPLPAGIWHTRIFAVANGKAVASQVTYRVAAGTQEFYPPVHQSATASSAQKCYDGNFSTYCDFPNDGCNAVWIFDCTGLDGFYPASIRFWRRSTSTLQVEHLRPRSAVVSTTADDIEWPADETDQSTAARSYFYRSAEVAADANWMQSEDMSLTQTDADPVCYDVALSPSLAKRAKYVKITNVGFASATEFEIRILRKPGLLLYIQ